MQEGIMRRRRRRLALGLAAGATACLLGATALALNGQLGEAQAGHAPTVTKPEVFSPGKLLVTLPWGSSQGEVGLIRPQEGLAHGPEALAVAPDGRIAVLDSVNKRVVCLNSAGDFVVATPVPLTEPRFLAVDSERLYVLDCDTTRSLAVLDWEGHVLEMLVLPELPDVVTGLFATAHGPSVEVAHESVYLVDAGEASAAAVDGSQGPGGGVEAAGRDVTAAGRDVTAAGRDVTAAGQGAPTSQSAIGPTPPGAVTGKRASLRSLPGRPLDHELSRTIRASFKPATGVQLTSLRLDLPGLSASHETTLRPTLAFGRALEHLISVDADGQGGLVVGARLLEAGSRSDGRPALALTRILASASGGKQGTANPVLLLADRSMVYVGQPYVVAPDGRIFQPVAEESGYSIFVHELPSSEPVPGASSAEEVER